MIDKGPAELKDYCATQAGLAGKWRHKAPGDLAARSAGIEWRRGPDRGASLSRPPGLLQGDPALRERPPAGSIRSYGTEHAGAVATGRTARDRGTGRHRMHVNGAEG